MLFYPILLCQDNYTALHLAVQAGKSAVVEALLGHGAQVGNEKVVYLYFDDICMYCIS